MQDKFKIGDIVHYMFGDTPTYKIMATKTQPKLRENMNPVHVPEGSDYLIIKTPLAAGEFAPFVNVPEQHLTLAENQG